MNKSQLKVQTEASRCTLYINESKQLVKGSLISLVS